MVCDKDGVVKDGVGQSCVWKMVCKRWCVKDGVWKMVCKRLKDGVSKMVCDKVVCQRWCVTKLCVKDGVWKLCVKERVWQSCVCERWCVKDGVWQSCVWNSWKIVCEREGVTKLCVWKMVCDKVVCERKCVTKWCERWCVTKWCERWCVKDGVRASPELLQEALCTAPFPRKPVCHTKASRLLHESQPRPSGVHAHTSSSRRLCVLRLPHESHELCCDECCVMRWRLWLCDRIAVWGVGCERLSDN